MPWSTDLSTASRPASRVRAWDEETMIGLRLCELLCLHPSLRTHRVAAMPAALRDAGRHVVKRLVASPVVARWAEGRRRSQCFAMICLVLRCDLHISLLSSCKSLN
eukprot:4134821-Prymnesium_polylepis.1